MRSPFRIRFLLALIPLAACTALQAQVSLFDLYRRAEANDPVWAAAKASRDAGLQSEQIGRAGLLPSLSAGYSDNRTDLKREAPRLESSYRAQTTTLTLTQPLFNVAVWKGYSEGVARAQQAQITFAQASQELILRVAEGYFNYLSAVDSLELAKAQKNATLELKIQSENLYQAGVGTITDIQENLSRYKLAEAQELAAANAVEQQLRELQRIVGNINRAELRPLSPDIEPVLPVPADIQTWIEAARNQNLKVSMMRAQLEIAGHVVGRERAGHLPTASLVAERSDTSQLSEFIGEQRRSIVGVRVDVPLVQGGRVSAVSAQAAANVEKARQDLESAQREAETQASKAYLDTVGGVARISAYEEAVNSAKIALEGMEAGRLVGLRTNSDVLVALQQFYSTKRDLQRERYAYLLGRLQIKAAVGSLDSEELKFVR